MSNGTLIQPLTGADRCDRCGAQAQVRAVLLAGDLLFCGHHGREHAVALSQAAVLIRDTTVMS